MKNCDENQIDVNFATIKNCLRATYSDIENINTEGRISNLF